MDDGRRLDVVDEVVVIETVVVVVVTSAFFVVCNHEVNQLPPGVASWVSNVDTLCVECSAAT